MHRVVAPVFRVLLALSCSFLLSATASGQSYPSKPIRMIFGFGAGGAGDVAARLLSQKLADGLGQPVIVENRTGAGGSIANELVAKSAPDGHTLLFASGAFATLPALHAKLPYDVERDFKPVSMVVTTAFALAVHPSVPVRDAKGLIALGRSRPGQLTFASPGLGSSAHLAGELFRSMAALELLHVPYQGAPAAATAVAAGHIDIGFPSITAALPLLASNKLRVLAVSSPKRSALMPSLPTLGEAGLAGYQRTGWNGVLTPAGVSQDVIARLNGAIVKILDTPEMKQTLLKAGMEAQSSTPEQFGERIRNELRLNAKLIQFAKVKVQ